MSSQNNFKDIPPLEHQDSLPPTNIGKGHPEYHFVQSVLELQKTMIETKVAVESLKTELNCSMGALKDDVKSVKTKIDDLVCWRNRVLGGAATIAFLLALFFGIAKYLDNVSISFDKHQALVTKSSLPTEESSH